MNTTTNMALRRLHATLLRTQRLDVEREVGRLSAGQLLQATIHDSRFVWLRGLTALTAQLDTGEAGPEDVRALLAEPDPRTTFGARYLRALQEQPDVVLAHRDVMLATAPSVRPRAQPGGGEAGQPAGVAGDVGLV